MGCGHEAIAAEDILYKVRRGATGGGPVTTGQLSLARADRTATKTPRRIMDTTLDAWDAGLNDGTFGNMSAKALYLVETYPDRTARELLQSGVDEGIYGKSDPNLIRPRLDTLRQEGSIIRGSKRACTVSEKGLIAYTYRKAWNTPPVMDHGHPPKAQHIVERESKTEIGRIHTTTYWHEGAITCTCPGCATSGHCNGAIGLRLAVDGEIREDDYEYLIKKMGRRNVRRLLESKAGGDMVEVSGGTGARQ